MNEDDFAAGCKLLLAAARGDIEMFRRLLWTNPRLNVNFRDYDRRTALHVAASEGHLHFVQFLIEELCAIVNRSDRWGGSPLDDAHRHRHTSVAQYIRSNGGRTGSTDLTANLISAAAVGDLDEVQMLVQHCGVDVNGGDYDSRTAAHLAAGRDHVIVLEFLLQAEANPNAEDRWGGRPLDDAIRNDAKLCVALLEKYNATRSRVSTGLPTSSESETTTGIEGDPDFDIDFSDLDIIEQIGVGAFGEIYKCKWRGTLVAAKCIRSARIANDWKSREQNRKSLVTKDGKKPEQVRLPDAEKNKSNGTVDDSALLPSQRHAHKDSKEKAQDDSMSDTAKELALADFRLEVSILKKLR